MDWQIKEELRGIIERSITFFSIASAVIVGYTIGWLIRVYWGAQIVEFIDKLFGVV